jgi:hypothetical protein
MKNNAPISVQSMLVRQMQTAEGQTPCFATEASNACSKKECVWRHDCFDEALDIRLQSEAA